VSKYTKFNTPKYVTYVDDFYPYKYVYNFLTYMLKNFQIKYLNPQTNRWSLEVFKNYVSCKRKKLLIPKNFIDEIVEHLSDFKRLQTGDYYLIFSRINDNLQKISNSVGTACSNLQNFLNYLKFSILKKKAFESGHLDISVVKHLAGWINQHLKEKDFKKAGSGLGKLFSLVAENLNYIELTKKSPLTVKKQKKTSTTVKKHKKTATTVTKHKKTASVPLVVKKSKKAVAVPLVAKNQEKTATVPLVKIQEKAAVVPKKNKKRAKHYYY